MNLSILSRYSGRSLKSATIKSYCKQNVSVASPRFLRVVASSFFFFVPPSASGQVRWKKREGNRE